MDKVVYFFRWVIMFSFLGMAFFAEMQNIVPSDILKFLFSF